MVTEGDTNILLNVSDSLLIEILEASPVLPPGLYTLLPST